MENELSSEVNNRELEMLTHIEANPDINQVTLADELVVAVGNYQLAPKRNESAKGYVKVNERQRKKIALYHHAGRDRSPAALTVDYIKNSFDLYRLCARIERTHAEQLRQA